MNSSSIKNSCIKFIISIAYSVIFYNIFIKFKLKFFALLMLNQELVDW